MEQFIDLTRGGVAWDGWRFGRYGRARDWRLQAPDGAHYTADELLRVRQMYLELDYLQQRVAALEDSVALYLTVREMHLVREAIAALDRVLPRANARGFSGPRAVVGGGA